MTAYGASKKRDKWIALTEQPGQFCSQTGKKKFGRKGTAKKHARQRAAEHGLELGVYKCRFCRTWHMTSQKPRVKV